MRPTAGLGVNEAKKNSVPKGFRIRDRPVRRAVSVQAVPRGTDPRTTNRLTLQASFHFNNLYALIIHGQFRQEQPFLVRYFEFLNGSSSHFTSYIRGLVLQPY